MLVVNLFGVPGAGKSTGAAHIYSELKMRGVNAEYIDEHAKWKVYEGNLALLDSNNQDYLFAKQKWHLTRVQGHVEVAIMDSPLPLCVYYNHSELLGEDFNRVVMRCFNSFNNLNFLVMRVKDYLAEGRTQTEAESNAMLPSMISLLEDRQIPYRKIPGDRDGYDTIVDRIMTLVTAGQPV